MSPRDRNGYCLDFMLGETGVTPLEHDKDPNTGKHTYPLSMSSWLRDVARGTWPMCLR